MRLSGKNLMYPAFTLVVDVVVVVVVAVVVDAAVGGGGSAMRRNFRRITRLAE